MNAIATTKILTDKEKDDLLKQVLGEDYTAAGRNLPLLKGLIDKIGKVDSLFTLTELLPLVNRILSVRVFSYMASGASIVSIFFMPIATMIDIINAYQAGRRMYAYRAIAYALTSWAFSKPILTNSRRLIIQAKTGMPRVDAKELIEYDKAWKKSSNDVVNKMNSIAITNDVPKEAIKIFLRTISDNNEQKLCEIIMKGFEKKFSFIELNVWKSNYKIGYPN